MNAPLPNTLRQGPDGRGRFGLRAIYALCLAGATYNHLSTFLKHGLFWDYGGVPPASAAFWTALTVVDPVAIVLLFVTPNVGVSATAAIIIADVIHNVWITQRQYPSLLFGLRQSPAVVEQIGFMIFVMATAPWARRRASLAGP